jgi:hypothetical protein
MNGQCHATLVFTSERNLPPPISSKYETMETFLKQKWCPCNKPNRAGTDDVLDEEDSYKSPKRRVH